MKLKAVSGIMLILLSTGMLTLAFNAWASALLVSTITSGVAESTRSEIKVMETRSLDPELFAQQDLLETIVNQINETRFMWFDSFLVNIGPRPCYFFTHANMEAAEFIAEELNTTESISVTYQWFTFEGRKIANVIGVLPSANPNNQSKIVVGAHFDTVGNSPGADDNGSGTALLLEVAKVLSQFKFNCTIEFVAFNAEEVGLFGSSYYVQQALQAGEDVLLMINIDMILWDNPTAPPNEKLWIVYNGLAPYEESERFADIVLNISYTYTTAPIKKTSFWGMSDHSSFWYAALPALMITENSDDFPNPYYHTPSDSVDAEGYNFTLGAKAAQVVAATVANLAAIRAHVLTVYSSPSGVTFTVNGVSRATPWSGTYSEGASINLEMPETHDEYVWSHWLPDGDTNRTKTITMDTDIKVTAVFTPDTAPPAISIVSPENKTYPLKEVPLTFIVNESTSWIGYSLDGQTNVTISGNTTIVGLSEGVHTITVYANDTVGNMGYSDTVRFTVDTVPPNIDILSPENKTYTTGSVPLSFIIDETASWIGYSLNGQANVTIAGNTTLPELSDGSYSLIVYAKDTARNKGASEIIHFSTETQRAEPLQTWIVAAVVIITGIGAVLIVYFAKVKKTTEKVKQ